MGFGARWPERVRRCEQSRESRRGDLQVVGNTAMVRHLWVSQNELEGKVTDTKIGVMQVWQNRTAGGSS